MPRPFPDPQQGHTTPKVHHPDLGGESSQVAWNEIHDSDRRQRSIPKHSSDVKIIPDDHHGAASDGLGYPLGYPRHPKNGSAESTWSSKVSRS